MRDEDFHSPGSLSTLWFVVVFTLVIFLLILSCFRSFLQEVVLVLFLAPSRTNNQPRQDLRDIGCYRAQSGGVSGEWKSSSLVYETSNPRDKHAGELFSAATATSTMATLLVSINSGLDTLARLDLRLRFLTHIITHHTDHGE
jgi:hypothetical protein